MTDRALGTAMAAVLAVFTSWAAVAQAPDRVDFSGWMKDYDSLEYDERRGAWVFFNEEKRGKYNKVMLHSVSLFSARAKTDPALAREATDYLKNGIVKIFESKGVAAKEPGPGVAQLKIAITGVERSIEDLKPRDVIPVGALFRGARALSGNLDTYIDARFEGEATDSVTGERLGAVVVRGIGETGKRSGEEVEFSDVQPTLDRWLAQYADTVDEYLARRKAAGAR